MATRTIKTVFQFRRSRNFEWEQCLDIIPAAGEPCYDLDLKTLRIGDGETMYKDLPVIGGVGSVEELQAALDQLQEQVGETNVVEIQENITQMLIDLTEVTTQVEQSETQITNIQQTLVSKADANTVYTKEEVYTKSEIDDMYVALDPEVTYRFSGGDI